MKKFHKYIFYLILVLMMSVANPGAYSMTYRLPPAPSDTITVTAEDSIPVAVDSVAIKKVLFIGDSMTGWLAERLNAYGEINGFEVATIVWDGSTITKWAKSKELSNYIQDINPDAIMVSLGMNELFEPNPENKLKEPVDSLISLFGDIPFLWIGPPSWPGQPEGEKLNQWLAGELGEGNFFRSFDLVLSRQGKRNPHPSRKGIGEWIDAVTEWIPGNSNLHFQSLDPPAPEAMSRGKTFIYKRMKEPL